MEGMDTSEGKLAIDVIKEVGSRGNFLSHPHTLKYFREEHFQADLADRNPRSVWERLGSKTLLERARERVKKILDEYSPPSLNRDTQKELEKAVREIYEREGVPYTPIPTEW
jgi:trimethylamine--corrinoid protein Co-methyltransferase